jgi:hypothetical protein
LSDGSSDVPERKFAMMTEARKRLVNELAATGIASPLLILLLALTRGRMVLFWLASPFFYVARPITIWINTVSPPTGGAWFEGLQTIFEVLFVFVWILVWMILFGGVKLIEKLIYRKKREA